MDKEKILLNKILIIFIISLFLFSSVISSNGIVIDLKNCNYFSYEYDNNSDKLLWNEHLAYIGTSNNPSDSWLYEFILSNPENLTCKCSDVTVSTVSSGTWTNNGTIITIIWYGNNSKFVEINPSNCECRVISSVVDFLGLAYNPFDDRMYCSSLDNNLYEIDPDTGEQEHIGPFGSGVLYMIGMAFDTDGVLYGWDLGQDSLWTINTSTGEATKIGSLGININYCADGHFCFDDDTLYMAYSNILYRFDKTTGECTLVGYFDLEGDAMVTLLAILWGNLPPYPPSNPNPPNGAKGVVDVEINWSGGDPNGDNVTYDIYFGTTTPPPLILENHRYTTYDPGTLENCKTYYWKIVAWDEHGEYTEGPIWNFTTNCNPDTPIITGPTRGRTWVWYEYNFSISDPDGDIMWIHIDWQYGTPSKWDGPYPSGSTVKLNYSWRKKGTYTIRAQTMDNNSLLSEWGTLNVTMPRNRDTYNSLFEWFFERFPMLKVIISRVLNL